MTAPPTGQRGLGHLPALDGLRGVAILLVLATHFYGDLTPSTRMGRVVRDAFTFGRTGVDLFFVLSGFLITRTLLVRIGTFRDRIADFWGRRALRIFPLYYAFLTLWTVKSLLRGHGLLPWPFWTYVCNWWLGSHPEYNSGDLAHFWSLAVEEQFYVVWPLIVLSAGGPRSALVSALGIPAALAFRCGILFAGHVAEHTPRYALAYFATLSRMDGLFVGALIAFAVVRGGPLMARMQRAGGLIMLASGFLLVGVLVAQRSFDFHPLMASAGLTATSFFFGSIVLALVGSDGGLFGRRLSSVLRAPKLRTLGTISYGVYVFNFPIAIAMRKYVTVVIQAGHGDLVAFALVTVLGIVGAGLSIAIAWASYTYFESRFLKLKGSSGHHPAAQAP
ncbi:MAG: acyltransferase family protein [Polyangiaceae bacterium]